MSTPPAPSTAAPAGALGRLAGRFREAFAAEPLLPAICLGLVAAGAWLRCQSIDFPHNLTFDEHHFVENARNYLAGRADWNDHPPLGKLLIAVMILLRGDNSLGWRTAQVVLGLGNLVLAFELGRRLFQRWQAAALAAAFAAAEGSLIAYSRTGLLDGMLTFFCLATAVAVARRPTAAKVLLASVLAGCAAQIKFSGACVGIPLAVIAFQLPGRQRVLAVLSLAALPITYVLLYMLGLSLIHAPHGPLDVVAATRRLAHGHLQATAMVHPLTSYPYAWFLPTRPITMRFTEVEGGRVRGMTSLGNLALWWANSIMPFAALVALLVNRRRARQAVAEPAHARALVPFFAEHRRAVIFLLGFWACMFTPWIVTRRDTYIYHYIPSYTFGLVLLAGGLAWLHQRRRRLALAGLVLVAAVVVVYAPVWGQLPITRAGWNARLFIPNWR
jgi:dolichyl-phosphate-mannose--protein O-mannosyl transferase